LSTLSAQRNQPKPGSKKDFAVQMLRDIEDGRYAVDPAGGDNYTFIRVSRPKHGKHRGAIKVQTQHSDDLITRVLIYPSGMVVWRMESLVELILIIAVNKTACSVAYGRKIGRCCRCGKTLTDERSRHYGIGPECEQHWPHIIEEVDQLEELGKL
jgi:hypothetical protein